ncbi:helix-turn-helix domain-containing protein [Amycolatopsis sp. H20-H5]|uniref:PucR family transcriptional regulator n=1 Tax=Amycolatopsis sp. H20-H5 TaxID=3046309 RepID=UPI002DBFAB2C|nr:helix-turn-helix domain-containing protein [Amycolatopsis sp. H20-H5]MEC3982463.1 helix-turn-helix domain-containing protein [Amycolatopsis sp. H20-H5]
MSVQAGERNNDVHPSAPALQPEENSPENGQARDLWSSLPRAVAVRFRPHAATIGKTILREIQRAVPEYAQPLEGPFGEVTIRGVEQAVLSCLGNAGNPAPRRDDRTEEFREIGKLIFLDGRSLDSLQAAYRIGGRAAWRYLSRLGQAMELPSRLLCTVAEAIFAYVEEISALSVEGYTAAQYRAAGTLERRRRRLLELILASPPSSPQVIADLAAVAGWQLPEWITVIALENRSDQHQLPTPSLDGEVLMDLEGADPCLLVAGREPDLSGLPAALDGWRAAVGPRVRLDDASTSLHWASRALDLMYRGVLDDGPVVRSDDHLSTLWLLTDSFLLREVTVRALEPLDGLTPKQQLRLGETLLAWIECRGNAPDIAELLKIHPQTVRYRIHQLAERFGERLNDPAERFAIEIALRAHRLLGTQPPAWRRA